MFDFKNWKKICDVKDKRIKELEGKFDVIIEKLEEVRLRSTENVCPRNCSGSECYNTYCETCYMNKAIEIVKGVKNERS